MKRLLVYSHDTYGLGNVRRMLSICDHLLGVIPDLSMLLITGSPVIHRFHLPPTLDYIKLPCLNRADRGEYRTRYLSADAGEAIRLRSDLILATARNFAPDLLLVDKKPLGVKGELASTLEYLEREHPATGVLLVLRDILDHPAAITSNWERNGHYAAIERYYDEVLVLGERRIFDPVEEYRFSPAIAAKTTFCGYVRREAVEGARCEVRRRLNISDDEALVLLTTGGGQDGEAVVESYLCGLRSARFKGRVRSLIVFGPEMPEPQRARLAREAASRTDVIFYDFTGEMVSCMAASDAIVAMGGYNTVCEILSLGKPAVVVPRFRPTEEQWMRAERMSGLGLFQAIHPDELSPQRLIECVERMLEERERVPPAIDLGALPAVARRVSAVFERQAAPSM